MDNRNQLSLQGREPSGCPAGLQSGDKVFSRVNPGYFSSEKEGL